MESGKIDAVCPRSEDNGIETGNSMPVRQLFPHLLRIANGFGSRLLFALDAVNVRRQDIQRPEQQFVGVPVIAFGVLGRYASFVHPVKPDGVPVDPSGKSLRPQPEHLLGGLSAGEGQEEWFFFFAANLHGELLGEQFQRFAGVAG